MSRLNIRTGEKRFPVAPDLYGLFFEDISRAGDGGLYPEMLRNRSFEDSLLPEGCVTNDGGRTFVSPTGWVDEFNNGEGMNQWVKDNRIIPTPVPAWYSDQAEMTLDCEAVLNPRRRVSLRVDFATGGSIRNIGFGGIPQEEGKNYRFYVFARSEQEAELTLTTEKNGQVLMAATTEGLIVAKLEQQADQMHFLLHQREASRAQSLSSSAVMDIMRAPDGRMYVSTESGGVNRIEDNDLLKQQLTFRHYSAKNKKLPIDVVLSMVPLQNGKCAIVSSHLVSIVDSTEQYRQLDARSFNADYRFSDARPQMLGGARWIFGLNDGAFLTTAQQMEGSAYRPQIVLTGVSIQGGEDIWAVTHADTLTLQPQERSITIHFAAIDYQAADRISYAFRLQKDGQRDTTQWNNIGSNRSVTLLDLEPGTYRLEMRSTNADGKWIDNSRVLTLIVQPTFWEAWYGKLLLVFILLSIVAIIIYTLLYIRRIKRQQRDTLEKYLNLIEVRDKLSEVCGSLTADVKTAPQTPSLEPQSSELDPVLQRVMQFVEENISNSEAGVGDMALAAAVSRSGLQRKLKQAMGITPQDLLREARIKRACQLLRETNKTVAEVAYSCGFTDPKYFSRSFKQSTGQSPTEYKNS